MKPRESKPPPLITIYRCSREHGFFYPHPKCPACQEAMSGVEVPAMATLVSRTMVRVSPTGKPIALGIATLDCGAKTLCIVDENVGDGEDRRVILHRRNDLYYATREKEEA